MARAAVVEPLSSVEEVVGLLRAASARDDASAGTERVSILDHGLQCAQVLRRWRPDDLELQLAGLVHDLGHVAVPGDADGHGRHGRVLLTQVLGVRLGALVELHVPAKRYLVTVDDGYARSLSPTSVRTLAEQGGTMTDDERAAFEREPHGEDALVLRRADEAAKVPGRTVPGLEEWVPRLEALAAVRRLLRP